MRTLCLQNARPDHLFITRYRYLELMSTIGAFTPTPSEAGQARGYPWTSHRLSPVPTQASHRPPTPATPGDTVVLSGKSPDLVEKLRTRITPGTLYVLDSFGFLGSIAQHGLSSYAMYAAASEETHGKLVNQAARETGFQGNIVGICNDGDRDAAELKERFGYLRHWASSNDPEVLSEALDQRLLALRAGTLIDTSGDLMSLYQAGVEKSVVNMSRSSSQVKSVDMLIDMMLPQDPDKPEDVQHARQERNKVALALGIPREKVESDNPQVRSEVREEILKRLVDRVATVDHHPEYLKAKETYDTVIELFVSRQNSVVVAAGNQQEVPDLLQNLSDHKTPLKFSDSFFVSDLSNARTLVVGAMDKDEIAAYSCRYPSVQIFANGAVGEEQGTSFATPRVAGMLAMLRQADLQARPGQLHARLKQHYCIPMVEGQTYLLARQV